METFRSEPQQSYRHVPWFPLALVSAAVLMSSMDTYVIVLALPAMMSTVGIGIDHLGEAAPIISGFLLGYIVVLPLVGRISDIYGRFPVFIGSVILFSWGSLITGSSDTLVVMVVGRVFQGLGGGGLIPISLALVADIWSPNDRSIPLGVVGAVQELGSVLGPVYGAVIISISSWQTIFWINSLFGAVIGTMYFVSHHGRAHDDVSSEKRGTKDVLGVFLLLLNLLVWFCAITQPTVLADNAVVGIVYLPFVSFGVWAWLTTPIVMGAFMILFLFCLWEIYAPPAIARILPLWVRDDSEIRIDFLGSLLAAIFLGAIIISFSAATPGQQDISSSAIFLLPLAAAAGIWFLFHERSARFPLIPLNEFRQRAAWGSLVSNFAVGAALMAVLVDVPFFVRTVFDSSTQTDAAFTLVHFLLAVPIGAVAGGIVCRWIGAKVTFMSGMGGAAGALLAMSMWEKTSLTSPVIGIPWIHPSDLALVIGGVGFGLAIAPVSTAVLNAVNDMLHGVASALVIGVRMMGMLVGISLLTTVGLHSFYSAQAQFPPVTNVCLSGEAWCPAYGAMETGAIVAELHSIFLGAAICAALAFIVGGITLPLAYKKDVERGEK